MPFYEEDDLDGDLPAELPAVDFTALLTQADVPPDVVITTFTPDDAAELFFKITDARDAGVPAGQTLLRGDPATGPAVSRCDTCGSERWYGQGPCSSCEEARRAILAAVGEPLPPPAGPPAMVVHHVQGELPLPPPGRAYDDHGNLGFAPSLPPPITQDLPYEEDVLQSPRTTAPEEPAENHPTQAGSAGSLPGSPALTNEDDDRFADQVAAALERLAPQAGQELETHQLPPPEHDDPNSEVTGWVLQAGRNAGKSYAGARWLHRFCSRYPGMRTRIIAPSFGDAVASCVEGPSGVLAASNYQVQWKPSHAGGSQLQWPNGSVCYVLGTPTPRDVDRLRALTNIDADWFEEAAANPQIVEAERQARLSRRRKGAKWIATTTPRPLKIVRDWKADPRVRISHATAHDNPHADPAWLEELEQMYKGTRLYAQEVLGQVLEDVEGAIWKIDDLDRSRVHDLAAFYAMLADTGRTVTRAAVGVDPANSSGTTGIVAVLMTDDRHLWVVDDVSKPAQSAEQWTRAAVDLATKWDAVLVCENDSGGDAIRAVLKAADLMDEVTINPATARGRGGKGARAEPVGLLWERDDFRGHIVGSFPFLEDEMTTYVPDMPGQDSPDRMDALVWACTYLWGRASFSDVTTRFPGMSENTGNADSRRPGSMIRWHKGQKKKERSQT